MASDLRVEPLTREAFAPFGEVIETAGVTPILINEGTTERFDDLAPVEVGGGRAKISLFRGRPRPWPIRIAMMERHPLGSQAFVPLDGHPYLVVAAGADTRPSVGDLRVFRASGDQGVNYRPRVWHHPLLVLEPVGMFLVVDRAGSGDNLDEVWFEANCGAFIQSA